MSTSDTEDTSVRVGPIRIRVSQSGVGPPLLMITGIGGNLDMWSPILPYLPNRRLIMFDFPGTGESGRSWLPPTMAHNALIVRGLLCKLGYKPIDVLGYSWGGVLAQHLAIQHPSMVKRLVLAATTPGWGGRFPSARVATKMATPRRYYSRSYYQKVAPTIYGGRFRAGDASMSEVMGDVRSPPSIAGYVAQLTAAMTYSSLPGLPTIRAPTLVIGGDDDPIVPTFNFKLLAAAIRRSTLHIVPGAGHLFLLDSPHIAAPIIDEFLSSHS